MKLVTFSVANYRSITTAHRITLSDTTVLIGRNNEGKSNLLKALQAAMALLQFHASSEVRGSTNFLRNLGLYDWRRDFPIQLQDRKTSTQTVFKLEFLLDEPELALFSDEIGSTLNGLLPLEVKIGKDQTPQFRVVKSGKGTKTLTTKSSKIATFVASRIHFNYIPAIRTESNIIELISTLLSQELRALESDNKYQKALQTIANLQKPILDSLATRVQGSLHEFLPSIRKVDIEISESSRRSALRRDINIIVDDGTPTNIEQKGDGIKSLAALGLLKSQNQRPGASILAIEEPESHLHPGSIHQVNEIIRTISKKPQVIVTTHNPLFVDRENIKSNIIVSDGSATPAKNVSSIRDLLGIKASDNLTNANYALIVEGEEDLVAMKAILPTLSDKIAKALRNNFLIIEPIGGAGNLSYKLSLLRTQLCATHTLLESDQAGKAAYDKAEREGLISIASCTFTQCSGMPEAEFEDCLDSSVYKTDLLREMGVDIDQPTFRGNEKWSQRLKMTFLAQGKIFSETTLSKAKYVVAKAVEKNPRDALSKHKRSAIDAAAASLERLLKF